MPTPVILPKQGNSVESCIIQAWLKKPGESVASGEALCEVETDKAVVEVECPAAGILLETFFAVDDDVPVLTTIAAIGEAGEDVSQLRPASAQGAVAAAAPAPAAVAAAVAPATPSSPAAAAVSSADGGSSPRARALAASRQVDLETVSGSGPQGRIIERDVQAAAAAGPRLSPAAAAALAAGAGQAPARGSGPAGLVRLADLLPAGAAAAPPAAEAVSEHPVKGVRKVIAERMRQSLQSTAQLTMQATAKAGALLAYRQRIKEQAEALGLPNITLNDMLCFCVARTLPRFPELNAHFLTTSIRRYRDVHLGIAVDTPRGLMVPVVRQAQALSLAALAARFKPLAKACIDGAIGADDLQGSTFTVTNLGAAGIDHFTPVLNTPEVAILGIGGLQLRPYREGDAIVHHEVLGLSLTIDHQALDGAPAARFLQFLVVSIENFELTLAD